MTVMIFDIETVPDTEFGREYFKLTDLNRLEIAEAMLANRRQDTGHEFLPHYCHKVVAISVVVRTDTWVKVWSLGEEKDTEKSLVTRFFDGIERYRPTLVSWNGTGFDLPVLHYRALKYGIDASIYWEVGNKDQNFKWNNYISRYHHRHIDVMDLLSGFQARSAAPLDAISVMLGLPGKMGLKGDQVFSMYNEGNLKAIRDYCEIDVINTYLVYLRFELMRGNLDNKTYLEYCQDLKSKLDKSNEEHFKKFLENWV